MPLFGQRRRASITDDLSWLFPASGKDEGGGADPFDAAPSLSPAGVLPTRALPSRPRQAPDQTNVDPGDESLISLIRTPNRDMISLNKSNWKAVDDQDLRGANALIRRMIGANASATAIAAALNQKRAGFGDSLLGKIRPAVNFRQAHPKVPLDNYSISVEQKLVPMQRNEAGVNHDAQSPFGAMMMSAADGLTFGHLADMTEDPERRSLALGLVQDEHPIASSIGLSDAALQQGLFGEGMLSRLGRAAAPVANFGIGAINGGLHEGWRGALKEGLIGLAEGELTKGLFDSARGEIPEDIVEEEAAKSAATDEQPKPATEPQQPERPWRDLLPDLPGDLTGAGIDGFRSFAERGNAEEDEAGEPTAPLFIPALPVRRTRPGMFANPQTRGARF